jgi:ATP phosphoribosyltransferase regulatory subunit
MSDTSKTLLPEGLRDLLPPDAAFEAEAVYRLTRSFGANGYELVRPPLAEFEDSLLAGVGAVLRERIFRMPDPVSHRTLGFRADMTTQVARIATTRLAARPRPLRLMYAGPVLRVRGDQLAPERQFTQAGIELIGAEAGAADVEAILATTEALEGLGIGGLTVDLALPTLVPAILQAAGGAASERLRTALDHKDVAEIKVAGGTAGALLCALVEASGAFVDAKDRLAHLPLPPAAQREWQALVGVAEAVRGAAPGLGLTVDAVESRGFEYHTGITFSIFARGAQREIGRGGRYRLTHGDGRIEPATGATLIVDTLLDLAPSLGTAQRLWVPADTDRAAVRDWQRQGYSVVAALEPATSPEAAARRAGCTHYLDRGKAVRTGDRSP